MTVEAILQILDDLANREAINAKEFMQRGMWRQAYQHMLSTDGIDMAIKEIRRLLAVESANEKPIAPPPTAG